MTPIEIADILDTMQRSQNDGRGVSCIRAIIAYIRAENGLHTAAIIAKNESDKLWQYPEIRKFIHDNITHIGYWSEICNCVIYK